jgi:CHASE2 domain-containing sensor protein
VSELHVRMFVSSPSDVRRERDRVVAVADRLNSVFAGVVRIEAIRWEDEFYSSPRSFQEQIDATVAGMAGIDILICILWGRIGLKLDPAIWHSEGHEGYESGTTYEYETALALNKRNGGVPDLYLFRKSAPILYRADHLAEDVEQHERLDIVWRRWTQSGDGYNTAGYQTFANTDEFERQVEDCLRHWLDRHDVSTTGLVWDRRVQGSPFCGLAAFDAAHSPVFFGRDAAVARGIAKMRTARFLLVIGASGSGKSSLLRAGLMPRIARPGAVPDIDLWRTTMVAPSGDTFLGLAQALGADTCLGPELREAACTVAHLSELLRQGGEAALIPLQSALATAAQKHAAQRGYERSRPARLLLAVDQLERLFVEAQPDDIAAFAALLRGLITNDIAFVVAALRSDAYGSFQSVEAFTAMREAGATHDLLPPNVLELEEIVSRPVLACHPPLAFEILADGRSLAEVLVNDAKGGDSLPLLQMTLGFLFDAEKSRGDGLLRVCDYRGMDQAVIQVASEAFAAVDEPARASVPALITAFVHDLALDPASGKPVVTVRPIVREAFEHGRPERKALIDAFVARRLLTAEKVGDEIAVRPVHDALLRVWPEAVRVLTENETIIRVRRTIEPLVAQWVDAGRSPQSDLLLTSPALLAGAKRLVDQLGDDVAVPMHNYIAASLAAAARHTEDERQRRTAIMSATGKMRLRSIPFYVGLVVFLLALMVTVRAVNPTFLERLQLLAFDTYQLISSRQQSTSPRRQTFDPVVIVDLDEASLAEIGQWPWPRTVMADLITRIKQLGALAIGIDIIFSEPDRMSPGLAAQSFPGIDDATRAALNALPSNDQVFADAIKSAHNVVIGQFGSYRPHPGVLIPPLIAFAGPDPSSHLGTYLGLQGNLSSIEQAAAGRGIMSLQPDADNVVRHVPIILKAQNMLVASLPIEMLRVAGGAIAIAVRTGPAGVESVLVRGLSVPTDEHGRVWVHFSAPDPARYVSAVDVLRGRVTADRLRGRLVLIGTSAVGLTDAHATPVMTMSGTEIYAQVLENMLNATTLIRPAISLGVEIILMVMIGIAFSIIGPLVSAWLLAALGVMALVGIAGGGWAVYYYWNMLIDPVYPIVTLIVFITVIMFNMYRYSEAQRSGLRRVFDPLAQKR